MASPGLGGRTGSKITVENTGSTPIYKGRACSLNTTATPERRGEDIICPVKSVATGALANACGVAEDTIAPGDIGVVTQVGVVLVETDDSVSAGNDLTILATSGNEGKFANGSAAGIYGRALMTDTAEWMGTPDFGAASTKTYAYAVVNFGAGAIAALQLSFA